MLFPDAFSRRARTLTVAVVFCAGTILGGLSPVTSLHAGLEEGGNGAQVLIGNDNDNIDNPLIQPAGVAANQSLDNADILIGGNGPDVLIGLLGSDVMHGGNGADILVGGTEQGSRPNSDIQFGESGADVAVWAPGDGSDFFSGGTGKDALVFGVIDKDSNNVPTLTGPQEGHPTGVPTANVTGMNGFCTLERVTDPALGFEWLVRFFVRSSGNLAVTIRVTDVEQVFCANQAGGSATFADLTDSNPQFVDVSLDKVRDLNRTVGQIIR